MGTYENKNIIIKEIFHVRGYEITIDYLFHEPKRNLKCFCGTIYSPKWGHTIYIYNTTGHIPPTWEIEYQDLYPPNWLDELMEKILDNYRMRFYPSYFDNHGDLDKELKLILEAENNKEAFI